MSNDLISLDLTQLPSTQIGSDAGFDDLARGGDFLGRLQLFTKGKAIDRGLIRPGHYGIPESAEDIEDLGDTIDIIPFCRKPKAMDMSDKDAIQVSYDQESPTFKRIEARANQKDANGTNCMFGPTFLVFERSSGRFLEFFCGSKSTRSEAKKIYPYLPLTPADIAAKTAAGNREMEGVEAHGPLALTLKSRLVEGKFSWHVPVVVKCSTPFSNVPSMELIIKEMKKFLATKEDGVEVVEESGKKSRAR